MQQSSTVLKRNKIQEATLSRGNIMKKILLTLPISLLFTAYLSATVQPARAASVDAAEAAKVARWWLALEIQGPGSQVPVARQQALLAALDRPATRPLWLDDKEFAYGNLPSGKMALAHVVEFPEGGYVVVAGDDRIEPVLAFDATRPFVWDGYKGEVARTLLSRMLTSWNRAISSQSGDDLLNKANARWHSLRTMVTANKTPQEAPEEEYSGPTSPDVNILLETASWSQGGYYNDTLQTHVGNNNSVPVGCTATMMGIFMRYFSWPSYGTGGNSYWDVCNGTNYYHSVNVNYYHYWSSMPLTSLTSANSYVADLLYECGVLVEMDYEPGGSGAWLDTSVMTGNYYYRGIETKTSSHETPIATTVQALVPVMLSTSSHSMVCDGYRDTTSPYFHINAGHDGGSDGWYSLTTLPAGDSTIDRSYPYCTPNNWAYVDASYGGTENGDMNTPYNTVSEGSAGVATYGQLWLKAGGYYGTGNRGTYTKAMTIKSYGGNAVIY
jgi:hypothetical protein